MVVLYQALALDAYFAKRKKSDFYLLFSLFWSIKKKWSWILSDFKPFLYFIFNNLFFRWEDTLHYFYTAAQKKIPYIYYRYTAFLEYKL